MRISSTAFLAQGIIPAKYTCDGSNSSPDLAWEEISEDVVKSFALIADDPDAPSGTWVHWVIYNIPATKNGLPAGVSNMDRLTDGTRQGRNSFRMIGYGGLCPPLGDGSHRYYFRLYALDIMLDLKSGASRSELEAAMKGHILGRAELMGRYERQKSFE